jgi:hypothetical protein
MDKELSIKTGALGELLGVTEAFAHIMADAPAVHTVARKRHGKMRPVCSASKGDIARATIVCDSEDTFMSVNAFIAPKSPESYGHMKEKYTSRLVACYSDIDSYKKGHDAFEAFGEVARLAFNRHIPQPSVITLSGRGLYLRWILKGVSKGNGQPELVGLDYFPPVDEIENGIMRQSKRHEWKKVLYAQVQSAIFDRLEYLGADCNARDMARVLRAPNSIHGAASQATGETVRVQYYAGVDPNTGFPYRYTLPELARWFGVALTDDERPLGFGRSVKEQGSAPARRNGQKQLGILRVTDYRTIERTMQAPTQGRRRRCLLFLADSLRIAGHPSMDARGIVAAAAARCEPPYPSTPTDNSIPEIVNDAYSKRLKYSNETLCRLFGITHENSGALVTIKPGEEKTYCQSTAATHRRAFIDEYLTRLPNASLREISNAANAHGHHCTHQTVSNDIARRKENQAGNQLALIEAGLDV